MTLKRKPIPKWMLPKGAKCPYGHRLSRWQTGEAFLFLLTVPLIEKGQTRNNQTSKGNQQANYPYQYQNDIRSRHITHLPSYVFRRTRSLSSGGYHPVMDFHGYLNIDENAIQGEMRDNKKAALSGDIFPNVMNLHKVKKADDGNRTRLLSLGS
ncbi:MAG: hypothetical protein LUE86_10975 [Clostridiales bacterium]|nr:hypothetical protein [Clostridiales bacterium]